MIIKQQQINNMDQKEPNPTTNLEQIQDVAETFRESEDNNNQPNDQPQQQQSNKFIDQQLPQPKPMQLITNKKGSQSRRYTQSQQNEHQLGKSYSLKYKNSFKTSKAKKKYLSQSLDKQQLSPLTKEDTEKQKQEIKKIQQRKAQLLRRITQLNKQVVSLTKKKQKQQPKTNKSQTNSFLPVIYKLKQKLNCHELNHKKDTNETKSEKSKLRYKVKTQEQKDNDLRQVILRNKQKMRVLDGKEREFKQVHKLHHVCLECSPAHKNLQLLNKDLIQLN